MKRLCSLFFLVLMALNIMGYYGLLLVIFKEQSRRTVAHIESSENEPGGDLLIRMPLASLHGEDDDVYSRAYGEFNYEGSVYHVIKQKRYHDTLYVFCLKDSKSTGVKKVITDYSSALAGNDQSSANENLKTCISFARFYVNDDVTLCQFESPGWSRHLAHGTFDDLYVNSTDYAIDHPPS